MPTSNYIHMIYALEVMLNEGQFTYEQIYCNVLPGSTINNFLLHRS